MELSYLLRIACCVPTRRIFQGFYYFVTSTKACLGKHQKTKQEKASKRVKSKKIIVDGASGYK